MHRSRSLKTAPAPKIDAKRVETQRRWQVLAIIALFLATLQLTSSICRGEEDAAKAYEARLNSDRAAAELRNAAGSAQTPEQKKAAEGKLKAYKDSMDKKKNLAEFKQNTMDNLASIKEMFTKAEDAFKEKKYREAGAFYNSVAMASVPGSETIVETSRGRLVELEDNAKEHLKSADDADLHHEYIKEAEELSLITHEFAQTKSYDVALRRMISLKGRPEVAGHVELAQAESLENDGKLSEAVVIYNSIANNPRYEHSLAALKASRKIEDLNKNEATRGKLKTELDAKADREAPVLLNTAKNFVSNNMPKQAIEKLEQVIEKFPESKYAESAKKQLAELK